MEEGTQRQPDWRERLRSRGAVLVRRVRSLLPVGVLQFRTTASVWMKAHPRYSTAIAVGVVLVAGTLTWLIIRAGGLPMPTGRTALERQGEAVFKREGCFGCHRAGQNMPAGPEQASLRGKVRWAPDLLKTPARSDDWQLAHLIDPPSVAVGSYMPSFGHLPRKELDALVAYLQSLKRDQPTPTPEALRETDLPKVDASLTTYNQGRQIYQTYCVVCHGQWGAGNGPGAEVLLPEPRDFTDEHWMSKQSDLYLFSVITNGKANTAMPSYRQLLSPEERSLVLSYIRYFADPIARQRMEQGLSSD